MQKEEILVWQWRSETEGRRRNRLHRRAVSLLLIIKAMHCSPNPLGIPCCLPVFLGNASLGGKKWFLFPWKGCVSPRLFCSPRNLQIFSCIITTTKDQGSLYCVEIMKQIQNHSSKAYPSELGDFYVSNAFYNLALNFLLGLNSCLLKIVISALMEQYLNVSVTHGTRWCWQGGITIPLCTIKSALLAEGWRRMDSVMGEVQHSENIVSEKIALLSFCGWWKPAKIYYLKKKNYFNKTPNCVHHYNCRRHLLNWFNLLLCLACQALKALNSFQRRK